MTSTESWLQVTYIIVLLMDRTTHMWSLIVNHCTFHYIIVVLYHCNWMKTTHSFLIVWASSPLSMMGVFWVVAWVLILYRCFSHCELWDVRCGRLSLLCPGCYWKYQITSLSVIAPRNIQKLYFTTKNISEFWEIFRGSGKMWI